MPYIPYLPYIPNIPYFPNMPYQTDHTHHTYPPYHTTPPPHHRGGRGTVPHPHHTTGGGGGRSHMGPVYGTHPIWGGGGGGGRAWCIYIYIYVYNCMCIYIYLENQMAKIFCPYGFCHFFWLLRVVPRYAHIRFEGCNFGNLVFQPWGMSCDDLPWPTPSCSTSSALWSEMPGFPVMICGTRSCSFSFSVPFLSPLLFFLVRAIP